MTPTLTSSHLFVSSTTCWDYTARHTCEEIKAIPTDLHQVTTVLKLARAGDTQAIIEPHRRAAIKIASTW